MTRIRILLALSAVAGVIGLVFAVGSPPDVLQRGYARIIHIHVPSAWLAFLAFAVTALGSIMWRVSRSRRWDRLAASSAEIGVLFTALALATGMIWGRQVWGTAWDWGDARMSTTALMFFVYLGYLALRRSVADPVARADRASVLGIVAVIQVPLVYFSVTLWRTLHQPASLRPDGSEMHPDILRAMLINLGAFTLIYLTLLSARMLVGRLEEEAEERTVAVAGASVTQPVLEGPADE